MRERVMAEAKPKRYVLKDRPDGLDPVLIEVWVDGDVTMKQGSDNIQLSEVQIEKLIASLSNEKMVTPSRGCAFCDLELEPELVDRVWVHQSEKHSAVPCAIRNETNIERRY
jgi:hypothetical protein